MNSDTGLLSCRKAAKRIQEKWSIIRCSREWAGGGAAIDTDGDKNKAFGKSKVKKQEMVLAEAETIVSTETQSHCYARNGNAEEADSFVAWHFPKSFFGNR